MSIIMNKRLYYKLSNDVLVVYNKLIKKIAKDTSNNNKEIEWIRIGNIHCIYSLRT